MEEEEAQRPPFPSVLDPEVFLDMSFVGDAPSSRAAEEDSLRMSPKPHILNDMDALNKAMTVANQVSEIPPFQVAKMLKCLGKAVLALEERLDHLVETVAVDAESRLAPRLANAITRALCPPLKQVNESCSRRLEEHKQRNEEELHLLRQEFQSHFDRWEEQMVAKVDDLRNTILNLAEPPEQLTLGESFTLPCISEHMSEDDACSIRSSGSRSAGSATDSPGVSVTFGGSSPMSARLPSDECRVRPADQGAAVVAAAPWHKGKPLNPQEAAIEAAAVTAKALGCAMAHGCIAMDELALTASTALASSSASSPRSALDSTASTIPCIDMSTTQSIDDIMVDPAKLREEPFPMESARPPVIVGTQNNAAAAVAAIAAANKLQPTVIRAGVLRGTSAATPAPVLIRSKSPVAVGVEIAPKRATDAGENCGRGHITVKPVHVGVGAHRMVPSVQTSNNSIGSIVSTEGPTAPAGAPHEANAQSDAKRHDDDGESPRVTLDCAQPLTGQECASHVDGEAEHMLDAGRLSQELADTAARLLQQQQLMRATVVK